LSKRSSSLRGIFVEPSMGSELACLVGCWTVMVRITVRSKLDLSSARHAMLGAHRQALRRLGESQRLQTDGRAELYVVDHANHRSASRGIRNGLRDLDVQVLSCNETRWRDHVVLVSVGQAVAAGR